jgi:predicted alpha/beta hydrolase family esterase
MTIVEWAKYMSHSAAIALQWGHESIGYFSKQPAIRLIIFVHGFGGRSWKTWQGAEAALVSDPRAEASDIVFFGYHSLRSQPALSAGILRSFVDVAAAGATAWNDIVTRATGAAALRNYEEVLFVAHSLGAPVTRRAILDGVRAGATWSQKVGMILFAPAHRGAYLIDIQRELSGSIGAIVGAVVTFAKLGVLSLDDLKPGSDFLNDLATESDANFRAGRTLQTRAKQVIFGSDDNVVRARDFPNDPPIDVWTGHGHCSICRCDQTAPAIAAHLK